MVTAQVAVAGGVDLATGDQIWAFHPALAGNAKGDVCLVFDQTRVGTINTFPEIRVAMKPAGAGEFDAPVLAWSSPAPGQGEDIVKWGDYALAAPDPSDCTFWIAHEYARSGTHYDWGTRWAHVRAGLDVFVSNETCFSVRNGKRDCLALPPQGPWLTVSTGVNSAACNVS